jgi:hypothetical protein
MMPVPTSQSPWWWPLRIVNLEAPETTFSALPGQPDRLLTPWIADCE